MPTENEIEDFRNHLKETFKAWVESSGDVEFDIYAKPLSMFAWAKEYIPSLIVTSAGGFFPYQAEGYIEGYPFYYRSESGTASVNIGGFYDEIPYSWHESLWHANVNKEGSTHEDFIEVLTMLLPKLERSKYLYEFPALPYSWAEENGRIIDVNSWVITGTEKTATVYGRGHTPEEAYIEAAEPNRYLIDENGFTAESQTALFQARQVSRTPKPVPERNYPEVTPVFHSTPYFTQR